MATQRILIFSLSYYPQLIGGAEVAIKEITDRCSPEEYEFHMVTNRYDSSLPRKEKIGNVYVHRIGFTRSHPSISDLGKFPLYFNKLWFQCAAFWKARQLHNEKPFDLLWAMMAHSTAVPAGRFKKMFPDVKYVLTLQEGDPPEYIEKKMRLLGGWFSAGFRRADVVQAISSFLADWARRRGAKNVLVIPNGVEIEKFNNPVEDEGVRNTLGISEGDRVLFTASRLVLKNGVDTVIEALPLLPASVKFVIAGDGPEEIRLRELARRLNVEERVIFAGSVSHDNLPAYLAISDVFVRASRSEGMGISFIEAMAAGVPVVATPVGGIVDFVFDPERNPEKKPTGLFAYPDDPGSVAKAVNTYLREDDLKGEIVENARRLVEGQYDWDLVVRKMKKKCFNVII